MLEAGTKRLLQFISINDYDDSREEEYEEIFTASDGSDYDVFGTSCSMSDDFVVIGTYGVDNEGSAYLFNLNGTEVAKLTPGDDGEEDDKFGGSVSIDEKLVVGTYYGNYVRVFSRNGTYERTIRCDDCLYFGDVVATLGNLIVTKGEQDSIDKLFIYSTEDGQLLKTLEQGSDWIRAVAISEQFIVSTGSKTIIYSNTSPDFPKIAEINQDGWEVAVAGDRLVIGDILHPYGSLDRCDAYLYKTDGTLVTALDRQDASRRSEFGFSVAITDDKVLVGAYGDDDQGFHSGSVFIYSAVTGEFIKKVVAPDGEANDFFGSSVCASDSHYVVGAEGDNCRTGAAYLFQSSE